MADSLESAGDDEDIATAIGLYALGELTLGQAAERVGVSRFKMRDILVDAGVELRLGPRTKEEAQEEIDTAADVE